MCVIDSAVVPTFSADGTHEEVQLLHLHSQQSAPKPNVPVKSCITSRCTWDAEVTACDGRSCVATSIASCPVPRLRRRCKEDNRSASQRSLNIPGGPPRRLSALTERASRPSKQRSGLSLCPPAQHQGPWARRHRSRRASQSGSGEPRRPHAAHAAEAPQQPLYLMIPHACKRLQTVAAACMLWLTEAKLCRDLEEDAEHDPEIAALLKGANGDPDVVQKRVRVGLGCQMWRSDETAVCWITPES